MNLCCSELEVHEKVVVPTFTREDKWAVQLVDTYKQLSIVREGRMEREIALFGDLFDAGILTKGVVDQLQYSPDTQELVLTDLKTRQTNTMPGDVQRRGHKLQLMMYKLLLDGLTRGSTKMSLLEEHLKLNFKARLSASVIDHICESKVLLRACSAKVEDIFEVRFGDLAAAASKVIHELDLPPVTSLKVYYEHQKTGEMVGEETVEFDEAWARKLFDSTVGFWRGQRQPSGPEIEELWKCDTCQYKDVCVWRRQKMLETCPGKKILDSPVKSPAVRIHRDCKIPNSPVKLPAVQDCLDTKISDSPVKSPGSKDSPVKSPAHLALALHQ